MAGTPQFVDVSGFQPNIDWVAYRKWAAQWDGIARVAIKSTEGTGFTDPQFAAHRAGAIKAGVDVILFYHYGRPDLNSAENEANWQRQVVGAIRPNDVLVLDYEHGVPQATAAWAYAWLARQEANYGGKKPVLYSYDAYIRQRLQDSRLTRYPLWLANWQFNPAARPACPPPWTSYPYLQYSDKATGIPGIAGSVDADVYLGPTQHIEEEEPVIINLDTKGVGQFYRQAPGGAWQCLSNDHDFVIGGAILAFYRAFGNTGLCGITHLGLPNSPEIGIGNGRVIQRFERATLVYDPQHTNDSPPGAGTVYLAHLDNGVGQDPRIAALQSQITQMTARIATLEQQLAQAQGGDIADLKLQLAAAEALRDQYKRGLDAASKDIVQALTVPVAS